MIHEKRKRVNKKKYEKEKERNIRREKEQGRR